MKPQILVDGGPARRCECGEVEYPDKPHNHPTNMGRIKSVAELEGTESPDKQMTAGLEIPVPCGIATPEGRQRIRECLEGTGSDNIFYQYLVQAMEALDAMQIEASESKSPIPEMERAVEIRPGRYCRTEDATIVLDFTHYPIWDTHDQRAMRPQEISEILNKQADLIALGVRSKP